MSQSVIPIPELLEVAMVLRQERDLYGAEMVLKKIIEANADHPDAHHELGMIYWQEGRASECIEHFNHAVTLDSNNKQYMTDFNEESLFFGVTNQLKHEPIEVNPRGKPQRVLAVIDYSVQPYSIGDFLVYIIGSMVAAIQSGATKIDFCFISDPSRPPLDPIMSKLVTEDNHYFHLMTFLPVVQLNPMLGSVFVFDSIDSYNNFISKYQEEYHLWPSSEQLKAGKYMYYDILKMVADHFIKFSSIPKISFNNNLKLWANNFFKINTIGTIPVTVNIRNNQYFHAHRNSNVEAWKEFFMTCSKKYKAKFIITCAASEIDERLRSVDNVVFSKDFNTNLMQDLALINFSAFHIGSASGPAILPVFDSRPYYIFNCDALPHLNLYQGSLEHAEENDLRFSFARELQSIGVSEETSASILKEFEKIWSSRDWTAHGAGERELPNLPSQQSPTWLA